MQGSLIKKVVSVVCSALMVSTACFAETPAEAPAETAPAAYSNPEHLGVYWDIFTGYEFSNWSKFTDGGHGVWANIGGGVRPNDYKKGGFNYGADIGYQIIRYLGLELGYYSFPTVSGNNIDVKTPYFYIAGRISYPLLNDKLSVFAKVGMAYQMIEYGGNNISQPYNSTKGNVNVVYGLGMQYYFSKRWHVAAQWLEIPKTTGGTVNTVKSAKQVPRADQFLIGLGYLFSV
ncbi:MAG: hypothetical protein COB66_08730 [Coxiella sp. (in: Bacteria)]|nr:MAG: hypothetical protein COB66_08730 [Coxiella sp. (in: g-proteobacteria)]